MAHSFILPLPTSGFILPPSYTWIIFICTCFGSTGCSPVLTGPSSEIGTSLPCVQLGLGWFSVLWPHWLSCLWPPQTPGGHEIRTLLGRIHGAAALCPLSAVRPAHTLPACAAAYWLCSSLLGFLQFDSNKNSRGEKQKPSLIKAAYHGNMHRLRRSGHAWANERHVDYLETRVNSRQLLHAEGRVALSTPLLSHALLACTTIASFLPLSHTLGGQNKPGAGKRMTRGSKLHASAQGSQLLREGSRNNVQVSFFPTQQHQRTAWPQPMEGIRESHSQGHRESGVCAERGVLGRWEGGRSKGFCKATVAYK